MHKQLFLSNMTCDYIDNDLIDGGQCQRYYLKMYVRSTRDIVGFLRMFILTWITNVFLVHNLHETKVFLFDKKNNFFFFFLQTNIYVFNFYNTWTQRSLNIESLVVVISIWKSAQYWHKVSRCLYVCSPSRVNRTPPTPIGTYH